MSAPGYTFASRSRLVDLLPRKRPAPIPWCSATQDGLHYFCKPCYNLRNRKYYLKNRWRITKNIREYRQRRKSDIKIFVKGMYSNMINRTNKEPERFRGIILKSKFYEIALTSYRLNQLHYNWCNNNCKRGLTSSVDRINNKRGYFHDNSHFACSLAKVAN